MNKIKLNDVSISSRLIGIYLIIVLIPVLIMGFYFANSLNQAIITNTTESYQYSLERISNELQKSITNLIEIPLSKQYDIELSEFLTTEYGDDLEQYHAIQKHMNPITEQINVNPLKNQFLIFHSNPTLDMSRYLVHLPELTEIEGVGDMKSKQWRTGTYLGEEYLINLIPVVNYQEPGSISGIMLTYIDQSSIRQILNSNGMVNHAIYLLNREGHILTSTVQDTSVLDEEEDKVKFQENEHLKISLKLDNHKLGMDQWELVYLAPLQDIRAEQSKIILEAILVGIICFFLALLIILLFTKSFKKRIYVLLHAMRRLHKGDISIRIHKHSDDEIGQLYDGFDIMAGELESLIDTIYVTKIQLQKIEIEKQKHQTEEIQSRLIALQRQINPHYLFNTLESIRMKVLLNGDRETALVIKNFANGFREMMHSKGKSASVKEELKFVKNFFSIMEFRFPDQLQLKIVLKDRRILRYNIFKFMIQPLVENAVLHGLRSKEGQGTVVIFLDSSDEFLIINVEDDGIGMSEEHREQLICNILRMDDQDQDNLALKNIYARLQLSYGEHFQFDIRSEEGQYTRVCVKIPIELAAE